MVGVEIPRSPNTELVGLLSVKKKKEYKVILVTGRGGGP